MLISDEAKNNYRILNRAIRETQADLKHIREVRRRALNLLRFANRQEGGIALAGKCYKGAEYAKVLEARLIAFLKSLLDLRAEVNASAYQAHLHLERSPHEN